MFGRIISYLKRAINIPNTLEVIKSSTRRDSQEFDYKSPKMISGRLLSKLNSKILEIESLNETEFQVFSQWGDDGIIQYLINKLEITNTIFIEFGVENYKESNTRFLLMNDNWSGLVIDGSKDNIEYIKNDPISWGFDLHATHAFITRENINKLISDFLDKGYDKEIGLLSIDIDGNDYWIWKEINVVNPIIVVVEYNAVFGDTNRWTIPYKEDFYRLEGDSSFQYWGASLNALCHLAKEKGYSFVGCNSNGNNSYFIRNDKLASFRAISSEEGFVESKFREYKDAFGNRLGGKQRLDLIKGKMIFDLDVQDIRPI